MTMAPTPFRPDTTRSRSDRRVRRIGASGRRHCAKLQELAKQTRSRIEQAASARVPPRPRESGPEAVKIIEAIVHANAGWEAVPKSSGGR